MKFMNEYEIEEARERHLRSRVMGPATETLHQLKVWANNNSDGWSYWPKPSRAAARLMEMIEAHGKWERQGYPGPAGAEATVAEYKKALAPIKAFRTRMLAKGMTVDFQIVEAK